MTDIPASANAEGAPFRRSSKRWLSWCLMPLLALAVATLLVRLGDLDMKAQRWIYEAGGGSWALGNFWFWRGVYDYGVYPAIAVIFAATVCLVPGLRFRSILERRRVCVFLILLGVLAPGVITNLMLKEHWGRPRPREVVEFGGNLRFEPVLTMDRSTRGYSFPSGHATMGFYFMGLFVLLHRHRRRLAWGFLVFGLVSGSVLGAARMLQGGHFLSDVIWAAAVCWFTGVGLYYALLFHRSDEEWKRRVNSVPPWAPVLGVVCGVGVVVGSLVGTPYREEGTILSRVGSSGSGALLIRLTLVEGDFVVRSGSEFQIYSDASGHGVPTSRVVPTLSEAPGDGVSVIHYYERLSGWFSELSRLAEITVPWERTERLHLDSGNARLRLVTSPEWRGRDLVLVGGEGTVVVEIAEEQGIEHRVVEGSLDGTADGFDGFTLVREAGFAGELLIERTVPPRGRQD